MPRRLSPPRTRRRPTSAPASCKRFSCRDVHTARSAAPGRAVPFCSPPLAMVSVYRGPIMSFRLSAALALGLVCPALANPIVAPMPWPQSNSKPPAPKRAAPGPEQCTALLSARDGKETVLKIPRRFLDADAAGWAPERTPSPMAAGVTGVALAAAVSLAGVGLARSRHRRALIGSAACVLAGLLLVNTSCSRIPHRDDLPVEKDPWVENLTPED